MWAVLPLGKLFQSNTVVPGAAAHVHGRTRVTGESAGPRPVILIRPAHETPAHVQVQDRHKTWKNKHAPAASLLALSAGLPTIR